MFRSLDNRRPVTYWREMIWGLRTAPYIAVQPPVHYGEEKHCSQWCFSDAYRSWNHKDYIGKGIVVEVYAAADEIELLVNGKSVGRKPTGDPHKYMAVFDTIYEPGQVEAVAYKDGEEIGRDVLVTAGDDVKLAVSVEGPGEIIGYGTAAPASEENFYDTEAMTYEGRIRAGVRATGEGVIAVIFTAGDKTCSVKILAE